MEAKVGGSFQKGGVNASQRANAKCLEDVPCLLQFTSLVALEGAIPLKRWKQEPDCLECGAKGRLEH